MKIPESITPKVYDFGSIGKDPEDGWSYGGRAVARSLQGAGKFIDRSFDHSGRDFSKFHVAVTEKRFILSLAVLFIPRISIDESRRHGWVVKQDGKWDWYDPAK